MFYKDVIDKYSFGESCLLNHKQTNHDCIGFSLLCLDYAINLRAGAGLNYDAIRTYTVTVECDDTKDTTTGTFTLYILRNQAPVITNLQTSKGSYSYKGCITITSLRDKQCFLLQQIQQF